jgi:hypothetical protein
MLTIGPPGFLTFVCYLFLAGLFIRSGAYALSRRNPDNALARALLFIY